MRCLIEGDAAADDEVPRPQGAPERWRFRLHIVTSAVELRAPLNADALVDLRSDVF